MFWIKSHIWNVLRLIFQSNLHYAINAKHTKHAQSTHLDLCRMRESYVSPYNYSQMASKVIWKIIFAKCLLLCSIQESYTGLEWELNDGRNLKAGLRNCKNVITNVFLFLPLRVYGGNWYQSKKHEANCSVDKQGWLVNERNRETKIERKLYYIRKGKSEAFRKASTPILCYETSIFSFIFS